MMLSIWIIAGKLKKYEPEVSAKSGKCDISGVRLYSEAMTNKNPNLMFITRGSTFFNEESAGSDVLCAHGEDWIKLKTTDIDAVFNDILDIFDEFNAWTDALNSAARASCTMQHFIDISSGVLPYPIFITDNQGNVIAFSKNFGVGTVDEYWDPIVLKGETHKDIFIGIVRNAENEAVTDWDSKAKIYNSTFRRFIGVHLVIDNEIVGSVVMIEYADEFNEGQCQIADIFCDAATTALARGSSDAELRTGAAMIKDLLEGHKVDHSYVDGLLNKVVGDNAAKTLILCKNIMRSDFNFKNSFATRLSQRGVACFTMVYADYIIAVAKHGSEMDLIKRLKDERLDEENIFGFSLPFTSVIMLPGAFQQAKLALERGNKEPGAVNKCVDYAYAYLLDLLSKDINLTSDLIHPALGILARYDALHKSDLFNTLYIFLSKERNVVETAKCLFIHRNSLLYRLQRIERLISTDLEDINVRMYLLLSYHIETQKQIKA